MLISPYLQGLNRATVGHSVNPLSPNSDENEIYLYIISICSNIQVMRIKELITKDKVS